MCHIFSEIEKPPKDSIAFTDVPFTKVHAANHLFEMLEASTENRSACVVSIQTQSTAPGDLLKW